MGQKSILVVEDDFIKQVGLEALLGEKGYSTVSCKHENTVATAIESRPDVIITDIIFDAKNGEGTAFIEELKEKEELKETEIILYTTSLDVSLEIELRKLKVTYYLIKSEGSESSLIKQVEQFFAERERGDVENIDLSEYCRSSEDSGEPKSLPLSDDDDDDLDEASIDEKEEDYSADFKAGEVLFDAGKYAEAIEKFRSAKNSDELKARSTLNIGTCYRGLKDYKTATACLQKGNKNSGDKDMKIYFYYEIGVTLQEAGKTEDAFKFFGWVYKQNKSFKDTATRLKKLNTMMKG